MFLFCILTLHVFADYTFLSIGDWGGITDSPYYTNDQKSSNEGMDKIAGLYDVETVLAVGDNFYSYGVDDSDASERLDKTFENVYDGTHLEKTMWYAVAGNHDHRSSVEAQIKMTDVKPRWQFPYYWYSFTKQFTVSGGEQRTVEFIMIDTVLLAGESYHDPANNIFVSATGPLNVATAKTQWEWIEFHLSNSQADYLWVVGHYPIWSPCSHGPTKDLVTYLKPLLEKYGATGYIAGHDHCASYVDEGQGPVYPMNGMGVECCYKDKKMKTLLKYIEESDLKFTVNSGNAHQYNSPRSGFSSYTMGADSMTIRFHHNNGDILYEASDIPRRTFVNLHAEL